MTVFSSISKGCAFGITLMWMGGLAQAVPFTLTQTYDDAAPEAFDHFGRSVSDFLILVLVAMDGDPAQTSEIAL